MLQYMTTLGSNRMVLRAYGRIQSHECEHKLSNLRKTADTYDRGLLCVRTSSRRAAGQEYMSTSVSGHEGIEHFILALKI